MNHSSFLIAFFAITVRYFDYALFRLSAGVLCKTFMPGANADKQLLDFFCVFSLSVLARPLGAIIFGLIGDSGGRVKAVKISTTVASCATSIVAILPGFESIGWLAVYILILSRMIFLMSLAGETDTIRIYVVEKIDKARKNTINGITSFCTQVGAMLAATVYYFTNSIQDYYRWRINFIIGGIGGVVVILLRHYFQETAEFRAHKISVTHTRRQTYLIIKRNFIQFLLSAITSGCIGGIYNFSIIFFATFISKIIGIISIYQAALMNVLLITTYATTSLISGVIADKMNVQKIIYPAIIISIAIGLLILLVGTKETLIYYPFLIVGIAPFYAIPLQIKIQSLFDVSIRVRMCSLSHAIGSIILSSSAPLICMILWERYHSIMTMLSFLVVLFFILLISVLKMFKI